MTQLPKPERLRDLELGVEKKSEQYSLGATFYYMKYKDQLVLTGKINDVLKKYDLRSLLALSIYPSLVILDKRTSVVKCFPIRPVPTLRVFFHVLKAP